MKCREFIEFMLDYYEGRLSDEQRAVFEQHISRCPPCGAYLETYRLTVQMEKAACDCPESEQETPPAMPEGLVQAILAARRARC